MQVESAPCRATVGPLTYVVAFANGGAKDVTQRYVSSFMATEKLRCGAWWDATLAPLRRLQLAGVLALVFVIERSHESWAVLQQALRSDARSTSVTRPSARDVSTLRMIPALLMCAQFG